MLLEMVSEECASYSNAMLNDGSDDEDDESEVEEEENNLKKEESFAAATVPNMLRQIAQFVLMIFVAIICTCLSILRTYIPESSLVIVLPSSVEEAASLTRVSMKLLEELSCGSVPERRKKDVAREIGIIEKSIGRIEKMSKKSKTQ